MINIERVRLDTPASERLIHFNNAGSSLMPTPVYQGLAEFLESEVQIGGYETVARYDAALAGLYSSAARLLNCDAEHIAFSENATRAWQMAFYSFQFKPGDKILTSIAEYGSNVIAYQQQARRYGVEVQFVPNDETGQIDCEALASMIDDRVKLISITHIPTGGGLVNPAAEVGRVANAAGIPYLLDACQSAGQMPLDVKNLGCDFLSLTGRKYLRGPRATGLLYANPRIMDMYEPAVLDQHAADLVSPDTYKLQSSAKRYENWEQHFAGKYGLALAIDYALDIGIEAIQERVVALADKLRVELAEVPGITLTDEGALKCGIVTFISDQQHASSVKKALAAHSINVSVSDGSGTLVSFRKRNLDAVVRASVHYFNTEDEIAQFIAALRDNQQVI